MYIYIYIHFSTFHLQCQLTLQSYPYPFNYYRYRSALACNSVVHKQKKHSNTPPASNKQRPYPLQHHLTHLTAYLIAQKTILVTFGVFFNLGEFQVGVSILGELGIREGIREEGNIPFKPPTVLLLFKLIGLIVNLYKKYVYVYVYETSL